MSGAYISKNRRSYNAKSSAYYFYANTKISVEFRICISVPLSHCVKSVAIRSFIWSGFFCISTKYRELHQEKPRKLTAHRQVAAQSKLKKNIHTLGFRLETFLKKKSKLFIFLWILQNFLEQFFYGATPSSCICQENEENQVIYLTVRQISLLNVEKNMKISCRFANIY